MSYDVYLTDESGNTLSFSENFSEGGTQAVGGVSECWLSITYNYSEVYGSLVRDLDGKKAKETIQALKKIVKKWKHAKPYKRDYWAPTPGNAVMAIKRLVSFAEEHPEGIWIVS